MNVVLACRRLRQQPGFSWAVTLTLTLGLGTATSAFSLARAILLRPLPYVEADRLVMLEVGYRMLDLRDVGAAPGELSDYGAAASLEAVSAFRNRSQNLAGGDEPERARVVPVSASLFPLLRALPQLGRAFRPEDEEPGADGIAILSDGLWRRRFGADRGVVGRTLRLDGRSRTVVGVMPRGFDFPHPSFRFGRSADLWIPLALTPEERADRSSYTLRVIARLRPGVDLATARAELATIARRMEVEHPEAYRGPDGEDGGFGVSVVPLRDVIVGDAGQRLRMLLAAVGLLLLIACANVAGLFLARGLGRRKEVAVRLALGARRGHLIAEALAEALVLTLAGGALGLLLAAWIADLLVALAPDSLPRLGEVAVDGSVVAFALALSGATAVLFSLVVPVAASDLAVRETLAAGVVPSSRRRYGRMRQALVVGQLALALVLLVNAGLVLRTLLHLQTVDAGFASERRLALALSLPSSRYLDPRHQAGFFQRLLDRSEAVPGVAQAALVTELPLTGHGFGGPFTIEGRPIDLSGPPPTVNYRSVSTGYFSTLDIPLRQGRALLPTDAAGATPTAVVNEAMVRLFFGGDASRLLGRRLKLGGPGSARPWLTVVGVVGDVSPEGPGSRPRPEIYVPYVQDPAPGMTLVVRTQGDPRALAQALRAAVRAEDPEQAVTSVRTLDEVRAEALAPQVLTAAVLGSFACLAVVLAALGVYGVAAYLASLRTRELGVRLALGADRSQLLQLLVRENLAVALLGASIGLAGALVSTRLVSSQVAGVRPTDPLTLAVGAVALVGFASLAAWLPARRASRVDPVAALRRE